MRGVRCWPMLRWCWSTSSASAEPKTIMISALRRARGPALRDAAGAGARQGRPASRAAQDLNCAAARARPSTPRNCSIRTGRFVKASQASSKPAEERPWRHAACLVADIGWRAHPDYRGEQSFKPDRQRQFRRDRPRGPRLPRAHGLLSGYSGPSDEYRSPLFDKLLTPKQIERARVLGTKFRIGHLISSRAGGRAGEGEFPRPWPQADLLRSRHGRAGSSGVTALPAVCAQLCSRDLSLGCSRGEVNFTFSERRFVAQLFLIFSRSVRTISDLVETQTPDTYRLWIEADQLRGRATKRRLMRCSRRQPRLRIGAMTKLAHLARSEKREAESHEWMDKAERRCGRVTSTAARTSQTPTARRLVVEIFRLEAANGRC